MRQPDDPGPETAATSHAWWQSRMAIATFCVSLALAMLGGAIWVGRSLQRLDDLDTRTAAIAKTLDKVANVTTDTAINVARIQGALGVQDTRHAEWAPP